ncbi:hypothetical protein WG922_13595 [Ramlibacter sp. AN1015]|uniref:hypothetical protein n=1 Tax=Ramlibacter sp. AN1015 TaxID=3133428 RepID=UPI0030BB0D61
MSISNKLTAINDAKLAIKTAIENKGVTVGAAPLADFASKINAIQSGGGTTSPLAWVRPPDWLEVPMPDASEEIVYALFAVHPNGRRVSFNITGSCHIDWGDGTSNSYASGATILKVFDFNALPEASWCSRGYRQALVVITAASATGLTSLNLSLRHGAYASSPPRSTLLDIAASLPKLTTSATHSLSLSTASSTQSNSGMLERVRLVVQKAGTFSVPLNGITGYGPNLKRVEITTSSGFNGTDLFSGTRGLVNPDDIQINWLGSGSGTASGMFQNCSGLRALPPIDASKITSMGSFAAGCESLETVDLPGTVNCTTVGAAFQNCGNLRSIVLNCTALTSAPGSQFIQNSISIQRLVLTGLRYGLTVSFTALERPALVEMFQSLGTANGAQTITISSTPGASSLTAEERAIATEKGFTLSG